eukprot:955603-Lingulodinium_polyedra.AAC.2
MVRTHHTGVHSQHTVLNLRNNPYLVGCQGLWWSRGSGEGNLHVLLSRVVGLLSRVPVDSLGAHWVQPQAC